MTMQVTTRIANLAARLATVGLRHRDTLVRIAKIKKRKAPDEIAVRRLTREKRRLEAEMHKYQCLLRSLSGQLAT